MRAVESLMQLIRGLTLACVLLLQACGTSHLSAIDSQGRLVGDEPVFPSIGRDAWQKTGTFPNPDDLRRAAPGMDKDQLYDLLGRPHFREGLFNVREWDYVFNFRTGQGAEFTTCQYKILFDNGKIARQFYWNPRSCARQLDGMPTAAAARESAGAPFPSRSSGEPQRKVILDADTLFVFAGSSTEHMLPGGRAHLDRLAAELRELSDLDSVVVIGYTDRLGSADRNLRLSQARAASVRDYLMSRGVPADKVSALGNGQQDALVNCTQTERAALIDCLQPNRRVEVLVNSRH